MFGRPKIDTYTKETMGTSIQIDFGLPLIKSIALCSACITFIYSINPFMIPTVSPSFLIL